jgi:chemotaxis protein methyltransferase CheR
MFGGTTTMNATTAAILQSRIGDIEFRQIQRMMKDHVGIVLQDNKKALVEARVNKRLRALGIRSYREYLRHLAADKSGQEMVLLIDAISTNVTHFFREPDHFDFMSKQVARWIAEGRSKLRYWCAAGSTGEEPYSMAMCMNSIKGAEYLDQKILATDISTRVLKIAAEGRYEAGAVEKIPVEMRHEFFSKSGLGAEAVYRVHENLKRQILFRRLNLNRTPYPIKSVFDLIFCRNVMIYFDKELRDRVIGEAHRLLNPGGFLVVGHAEALLGLDRNFEFVKPSVYRKA